LADRNWVHAFEDPSDAPPEAGDLRGEGLETVDANSGRDTLPATGGASSPLAAGVAVAAGGALEVGAAAGRREETSDADWR
jgi:hypothetical protein